jgi:hypothetical protein
MKHMSSMPFGRKTAFVLYSWFAIALTLSVSGLIENLPVHILIPSIFIQFGVVMSFLYFSKGFRNFITGINLRWLTMFHMWRLLPGINFIVLAMNGTMPLAMISAGIGDIIIAIVAPIVADRRTDRRQYIFHVLGFVDLVHVLVIGATLTLQGDPRMSMITFFPMSLLPLFLVPLTLSVHGFALFAMRSRPAGPPQ